jgi:hypothetical protein
MLNTTDTAPKVNTVISPTPVGAIHRTPGSNLPAHALAETGGLAVFRTGTRARGSRCRIRSSLLGGNGRETETISAHKLVPPVEPPAQEP